MDSDIRRTIIQFGRCFLTGSISGFFLCAETSTGSAMELANAIEALSRCSGISMDSAFY